MGAGAGHLTSSSIAFLTTGPRLELYSLSREKGTMDRWPVRIRH